MRLVDDKLGPDGCLSSDGSSAGLTEEGSIVMQLLEPMYQQVCNLISRADFWILIGKLVLKEAIHPPIEVAFQYGRLDNRDCEGGAGRQPDDQGGQGSHGNVVSRFGNGRLYRQASGRAVDRHVHE